MFLSWCYMVLIIMKDLDMTPDSIDLFFYRKAVFSIKNYFFDTRLIFTLDLSLVERLFCSWFRLYIFHDTI